YKDCPPHASWIEPDDITLKFVNFTDGDEPNKALVNHEVDLNAFQHYAYLKSWNKANNGNIVSIGDTIITPIHLYSTKYKKVDEIPDKSTIFDSTASSCGVNESA
ncbi:hypothetical protein FDX20_20785, partial [Citrobacter sp. TBCS-11]